MKTQMRFQKILMLVTLIISAITFVYALSFSTPIYNMSVLTSVKSEGGDMINGDYTYGLFQQYNVVLIVLSVIFICLVALCYIMACQKRRNYYITNYIALITTAAYALVFCILIIVFTAVCHVSYVNDVDWATFLDYSIENPTDYPYNDSTAVLWIGYIVAILVFADVAAIVYNMIWKIKLMKGEKQLLAEGLVKEVA